MRVDSRSARGWLLRAALPILVASLAGIQPASADPRDGSPRIGRARPVPFAGLPYERSTALPGVGFETRSFRKMAPGSDNWPVTMTAGGRLLTSFADGGGFGDGAVRRAYVSLGVAELTGGNAASVAGRNLIGGLAPTIDRCMAWAPPALRERRPVSACRGAGLDGKSTGILALGSDLYMWITPGSYTKAYREARLYKAPIGSNDWTAASWAFTPADGVQLLKPTFLQAGPDGADVADYLYAYAAAYAPVQKERLSVQLGPNGGELHLMRAPRGSSLLAEASWQFFGGLTPSGDPTWVAEVGRSRPVLTDRNGMGVRPSAAYVKELRRYIVMAEHTADHEGHLGMFESETPWGPWRTVYYDKLAGGGIDDTAFFYNFLPGSFSADGRSFTLVFTGTEGLDALAVVDGTFTTGDLGAGPPPDEPAADDEPDLNDQPSSDDGPSDDLASITSVPSPVGSAAPIATGAFSSPVIPGAFATPMMPGAF